MSNIATGPVAMYHIVMGENEAIIMRVDHENGDTTLCVIFSRVSGISFLQKCVELGAYFKIDYQCFENSWEMFNFPDFHDEAETIIDGHSAELLCYQLGTYIELVDAEYDLKEVYNLFKGDPQTDFCIPIRCQSNLADYRPKEVSALLVNPRAGVVTFFYDMSDAMALVKLSEKKTGQKQTRKAVLHSALPHRGIEPARAYTGVTAELIAYLFWIDREFGEFG